MNMEKDDSCPGVREAEAEGYRLGSEAVKRAVRAKRKLVFSRPSDTTLEKWREQHDAFLAGWMRAMREGKDVPR